MKKNKYFVLLTVSLGVAILGSTLVFAGPIRHILGARFKSNSPASTPDSQILQHTEGQKYPTLALSGQALANIGIGADSFQPLKRTRFEKTVPFPAILVDRPGRSTFQVPSSVSGVVSRVYREQGESVQPGQPLFDIVLVHEDLVECQVNLLGLFQQRHVVEREISRLSSLSDDLAPKAKRDLEFQRVELNAQIVSQKAILVLHGLSRDQVESFEKRCMSLFRSDAKAVPAIDESRLLIRELTVRVPEITEEGILISSASAAVDGNSVSEKSGRFENNPSRESALVLERLNVEKGQLVSQGETLCQISDLSKLYVEGRAFARDESLLNSAFAGRCPVWVLFEDRDGVRNAIRGLRIKTLDNRIDPTNRTLFFYAEIENRILNDRELSACKDHPSHEPAFDETGENAASDKEYLQWKYKPGQRCEIFVEYETIPDCIVVPRSAVVEEGPNAYVFVVNGVSRWTLDGTRQLTAEEIESEMPFQLFKVWEKRPITILARDKKNIALQVSEHVNESCFIAYTGVNQLADTLNAGNGKLQSTCPCGDH